MTGNNHQDAPKTINDHFFNNLEQEEVERRWPVALREISSLLTRIRDIKRANPERLPKELIKTEKKRLTDAIFSVIMQDNHPELKRSVARRMANKIGDYVLWRRETSIPVIHELVILLPWWISHMPGEVIPKIREIGLKYILNGRVVAVQNVWEDLLNSHLVYMGHCACRSAGVVDDLYQNDKILCMVSENENRLLLDRFVDRYEKLVEKHGHLPNTDENFIKLCEKFVNLRATNSLDYKLETLFADTYPHWEILPVHSDYTPSWIRSMHKNHKAHQFNKEMVFELASIFYLARGSIFTSMKLFDTRYTICTCPTPESDGGCTLTNWYYWDRSHTSLLPNLKYHGRRKNKDNEITHCQFFPKRATRRCIGCGCKHDEKDPRSVEIVLQQADETYGAYIQGKTNS